VSGSSEALSASSDVKKRALGYAACAAAGCLWGTGFYFSKIALEELAVAHMVFYRILFGCVGLLPFAIRQAPLFDRGEWQALLGAAFLGVPVQFIIQFYGLSLTTVSHAALMVGAGPVVLAAGATLFGRERLDRTSWLALIGSTAGVSLVVLGGQSAAHGHGPSTVGDLLVLLSLVAATGWILANKRLMMRHSPVAVTSYGLLCGFGMLAVAVLLEDGPPPVHGISPKVWWALAASGLLCTASTTLLWNWGLHRVPASRAGVFLNIEPVLGSVLGVKLLGDRLGPWAWAGAVMLIAAAATLTTRPHGHVPEIILE
jgi:drug/metabolite transporter (DMT)-like permease